MTTVFSVIFGILIFSVLIFVHELGHFLAAKASGVQVNEFAIFMGPAIFKKQGKETLYTIRCIPLGGYCAMEGEDEDTDNPRSFQKAVWWKRLIILVSGALMNFLIGIVLFVIVAMPIQRLAVPVVSSVTACCPNAHENQLMPGDRILEVNGETVFVSSDISVLANVTGGYSHDFLVERNGRQILLEGITAHDHYEEGKKSSVRFGFSLSVEKPTFEDKLVHAWNLTIDNVRNVRLSLIMLFTGKAGFQDMMGPVGLVSTMTDVAQQSKTWVDALLNMLYFGGFIAVNLGVMNLLPIPALDGGRVVGLLVTTAIEGVTKKKIDPKYEGYIHGAFMVLLLALMAVVLFKDVFMIFKG